MQPTLHEARSFLRLSDLPTNSAVLRVYSAKQGTLSITPLLFFALYFIKEYNTHTFKSPSTHLEGLFLSSTCIYLM